MFCEEINVVSVLRDQQDFRKNIEADHCLDELLIENLLLSNPAICIFRKFLMIYFNRFEVFTNNKFFITTRFFLNDIINRLSNNCYYTIN